jgi:hypothetical protein
MNLDRTQFRVSSTADNGVVSSETCLELMQRGVRIFGRYGGGSIRRLHEHFTWTTRDGSGTNTFDQVAAPT